MKPRSGHPKAEIFRGYNDKSSGKSYTSDGASVGNYTFSIVNSIEYRGRPYQRGRLRHRKTNHRKLQNITNLSTIKSYNSGSISELTLYSTDITHHGTTQEKKGKMTSKLTLLSTDTIHRGTAQEKK